MSIKKKEEKRAIEIIYDQIEKNVWQFFMEQLPQLGFESREGQEDMALDLCSAIRERQHMMVEAGVGIGKSYGYIVPLMYYNKFMEKPVIIATSTIALQEQLIQDIRQISVYLDHRPEVVLAKGMTHFGCRNRAEKYIHSLKPEELNEMNQMLYEYIRVRQVERSKINLEIPDWLWDKVNVQMTDHSKCRYFGSCRFMELRQNMMNCNGIIVCNQDLLTVHLQKIRHGEKGLINEKADIIVVDEAHNLEEKVRSSLMVSYRLDEMRKLLTDISESIEKKPVCYRASSARKEASALLGQLFVYWKSEVIREQKVEQHGEVTEKYSLKYQAIKTKVEQLRLLLEQLKDMAQLYSGNALEPEQLERLKNLQHFFNAMGEDKQVFWLELGDVVVVCSSPRYIDDEIRQLYFKRNRTTILTSATLIDEQEGNEKEQYSYYAESIGFPIEKGYLSPPKPSPFPYDRNTMLYYTEDLHHPTEQREAFIAQGIEEVIKLLAVTDGRTLILFTAKRDLRAVYEEIKSRKLSYQLLKQSNTSSQEQLIEQFKESERGVLFATGTFWEGIDIPGSQLSQVIIFRLPFPVPDPILEGKRRKHQEFFDDIAMPLMILRLRQGVGRLIRKESDCGVISIIDPRLGDTRKSKYKEKVFLSLPIKNRTNKLSAIQDFWNKQEKSLAKSNKKS